MTMKSVMVLAATLSCLMSGTANARANTTIYLTGGESSSMCQKGITLYADVFPDKVVMYMAVGKETIAVSPDGSFSKEYGGASNLKIKTEGNINSRTMSHQTFFSNYSCSWTGKW